MSGHKPGKDEGTWLSASFPPLRAAPDHVIVWHPTGRVSRFRSGAAQFAVVRFPVKWFGTRPA